MCQYLSCFKQKNQSPNAVGDEMKHLEDILMIQNWRSTPELTGLYKIGNIHSKDHELIIDNCIEVNVRESNVAELKKE